MPLLLLGLLSLGSLGARAMWLDRPARALVFDEAYYVNAARIILGLHVPANGHYAGSPPGLDPNQEHPPLGKLLIALGMRVFGDNALGWRILPLIFGSLAVLAMYWLVRSAGGGRWLALGAAGLMAADNLSLVHGRIATLDVFVVAFMLAAVALYLHDRPVLAGAVLGVGCCTKLVAPYALLVLALLEAGRVLLRTPDHVAPFEHHDLQTGHGEIGRAHEPVMPAADDDGVVFGMRGGSHGKEDCKRRGGGPRSSVFGHSR